MTPDQATMNTDMPASKPAAYEINGQLVSAEQFYRVACDPRRSVAVEACAGAGKTWMLVSRILRALLDGAQPHNILAITFTKKAAGEMRERLMAWLSEFAKASPAQRCQALVERGVSTQEAQTLQEPLGQLYRQLLQNGRPVQVRTFHSWFAALLRSAPMGTLQGLGLPWPYELLEDDAQAVALVWPRFYKQLETDADAHQAFRQLVMQHGRSNVQKALEGALAKRIEFTLAERRGTGVLERSVPDAAHWMQSQGHAEFAGLAQPLDHLLAPRVKDQWLTWARLLGQEKNKTPQDAAQAVIDAYALLDDRPQALTEAFAILRKVFFVATENRLTKHLQKYLPAQHAEPHLQALCEAQAQHEAWRYQHAMTRLTRVLITCFADLKRERGWVDMNDIELAALHLLSDTEVGAWVQERLDASVSHLLIDEFQDTNPLQWHALSAWLASYAGASTKPCVFMVGDPKQSIYRFRRAEPQVFNDAQHVIQALGGDLLSCDHTRRNAPAVIEALNQTFAQAQQNHEFEGFRAHTTDAQQRGVVGRLPVIPRGQRQHDVAQLWRDSLNTPREQAEETLRSLECQQAAQFVAQQLASGLRPQDIMVLARKRDRLSAMNLALRALGMEANLAEKKDLVQAPEVQDLVALLDVLISTPHNLSLARALKSPLFAVSDEALVLIAACSAGKSWWQVLSNVEHHSQSLSDDRAHLSDPALVARLKVIFECLQRWQHLLQSAPPHDALSRIYDEGDVIARFVAAAPATLRDTVRVNLQALLSAALQVDGARFLTPYAWVRALKAGGIQAPQRQRQQAVQLLTVHGAKGLEAPCVILLDTDAPPAKAPTMGVLIDWPGAQPAPEKFLFMFSEKNACPSAQALLAHEQAARAREELNSLYVAMTRAKTHLVLSSVTPHQASPDSWWQRVTVPDLPPPDAATVCVTMASTPHVAVLPALTRKPELGLTAPDTAADVDSDAAMQAELASRMGQAMHRLLEWAPLGASDVGEAQRRFAGRAFGLTEPHLHEVCASAQAILRGQGAWAWDPQQVLWHANEVPVVVAGQMRRIDRLVRLKNGVWWVIDYKSARDPQAHQDLLLQLHRYRDAVAKLHPGQEVRAAFFNALGQVQELSEVLP